jgi:hypothetical protein
MMGFGSKKLAKNRPNREESLDGRKERNKMADYNQSASHGYVLQSKPRCFDQRYCQQAQSRISFSQEA